MAPLILLKQIGSTLDSIGKSTTKPILNMAENIIMAPFNTMENIASSFSSNPMTYIMIAGIIIIVINK